MTATAMTATTMYLPDSVKANKTSCLFSGSGERVCTYQQLDENTTLISNWLRRMNVGRLGLHADNSPAWIMLDLACQKAGVVTVPLPSFFSASQLKHVLRSCSIDSIITDQPIAVGKFFDSLEHLVCPITGFHLLQRQLPATVQALPEGAIPKRTSKVTFTSGTTGYPKGVCLSDTNQFLVANSLAEIVNLRGARHLCLLPLAILLENVAGVYASLLSNGEIVAPSLSQLGVSGSSSIDFRALTATIDATRPNSFICLPEILAGLVSAIENGWRPPTSLKFIAVGGARVSPSLPVKARELGLPVYEGYGLSECASVVSLNTPADNRPASVGKPLAHLAVNVVEDGEIIVRGNTFLGYAGEPGSWYADSVATGDIGAFDGDFLQVRGRGKNVLISSFGRNIHPEWVESELLCYPAIAQAFVFGEARPYCTALIAARRDDVPDALIQRWIDQANSRLPDYARVNNWHRLEKKLTAREGLITPNGRPKRDAIFTRFSQVISDLYATPPLSSQTAKRGHPQ